MNTKATIDSQGVAPPPSPPGGAEENRETSNRVIFVFLCVFFVCATALSWPALVRVYTKIGGEDEVEAISFEETVPNPPALSVEHTQSDTDGTSRKSNQRHDHHFNHHHGHGKEPHGDGEPQKEVRGGKATKHYSHGMLQRVVESAMKRVYDHRRSSNR